MSRNGVNFTLVTTEYVIANGSGATNRVRMYVLPNADVGTYNIVMSCSGSNYMAFGFVTYTGTATTWTGNFAQFTENNGISATRNLTIGTNNSWGVIMGQPNGTTTAGSGTVQRHSTIGWMGDSNSALSTGTTTLNVNQTPTGWNCYGTVEIQPQGGTAPTANPAFLLNFI